MNSAPSSPLRRTGPWTEFQTASALLERLLDRYLGSSDPRLGRFLFTRADEELVVRLRPSRIASWDYSRRMDDAHRTIRAPG